MINGSTVSEKKGDTEGRGGEAREGELSDSGFTAASLNILVTDLGTSLWHEATGSQLPSGSSTKLGCSLYMTWVGRHPFLGCANCY